MEKTMDRKKEQRQLSKMIDVFWNTDYFFQAKHVMMGNRRTMLMMNSLYIPFGALMLVMYDKALINYKNKFQKIYPK